MTVQLSAYELQRLAHIQRNQEFMARYGFRHVSRGSRLAYADQTLADSGSSTPLRKSLHWAVRYHCSGVAHATAGAMLLPLFSRRREERSAKAQARARHRVHGAVKEIIAGAPCS